MTDYMTNDADLATVANAIRAKGGTAASLAFPSGFATAIGNISASKPEQSKAMTLGSAAPAAVFPDSGYALSSVSPSIDTSVIKADNIASGVTMLGITGTHQGGVTPSGNINITTIAQTDVTNYATAQVVDSDLVAENIKQGVDILGVLGTFAGGGDWEVHSGTVTPIGEGTMIEHGFGTVPDIVMMYMNSGGSVLSSVTNNYICSFLFVIEDQYTSSITHYFGQYFYMYRKYSSKSSNNVSGYISYSVAGGNAFFSSNVVTPTHIKGYSNYEIYNPSNGGGVSKTYKWVAMKRVS